MKYYQLLFFYIFTFIQLIWAHGIHHDDHDKEEKQDELHHLNPNHDLGNEHEHEDIHNYEIEKEYPISTSLAGIGAILLCSFFGTILPIIFKKKSFFKEDTLLFNCVKLFGTGVILSVAFIHMVIPAGQILSSEYTFKLFNESYTSFAGIFAILGIILTHIVQIYTSHFLNKNLNSHESFQNQNLNHIHNKNYMKSYNSSISSFSNSSSTLSDSTNTHTTSVTLYIDNNDIHSKIDSDITDIKKYHDKREQVSVVDGCAEEQHRILHLMENKEKQMICYLLEIGISLHSILIGIAFGMTKDEELPILMIALTFHQFFEGVSLSSVFIEAHFNQFKAIFLMIIVYSLTLPIGGIIGILIRSAIESTDKIYLTTQGIIDAVAGGILIYDDLVNILSRHCNSKQFKEGTLIRKNIQLIAFYCGIIAMALIGIWA